MLIFHRHEDHHHLIPTSLVIRGKNITPFSLPENINPGAWHRSWMSDWDEPIRMWLWNNWDYIKEEEVEI